MFEALILPWNRLRIYDSNALPIRCGLLVKSTHSYPHHKQSSMALSMHLPDPTVTLPSASTFDFIPSIYALVSRLLLDPTDKDALQPKDVAAAVVEIKQKIHRARNVIESLPEIHRTIENQELEIADLEAKITRQKAQLISICERIKQWHSDSNP